MAQQRNRLSSGFVSKAQDPGRYADGGNLYLQVSEWRTKSWLFRYKVAKTNAKPGARKKAYKDVWVGLGSLHDVTLKDARELARELRQLQREGKDPLRELRRQRRQGAHSGAKTFREVALAYIESNAAGWSSEKHAQQWTNTLTTYAFPSLGDEEVATIDVQMVLDVLTPIWKTKTETATRVRSRIEAVLDYAAALELREGENPARWQGKLKKLLPAASRVKRVRHHPALPYRDVNKFISELRGEDSTAARALEFTILTAARTSEVLGLTWAEIDLERGLWTVPGERMKAGKEHQVPLCDAAVAILKATPKSKRTGYVFKGRMKGRPLSNMTMSKVLKRLGHDDVTVHGFRSTFRDWCAEQTDYPHAVAEQALAHTISDLTEAAYRRGQLLKKRTALMADWCAYCEKAPAKVARLRGRRNG